jgi:hypothetical protein
MELELTVAVFMGFSFFIGEGVHPPPFLDEFENKGFAKWVPVSAGKERGDF